VRDAVIIRRAVLHSVFGGSRNESLSGCSVLFGDVALTADARSLPAIGASQQVAVAECLNRRSTFS
jgi:hypothetical protein